MFNSDAELSSSSSSSSLSSSSPSSSSSSPSIPWPPTGLLSLLLLQRRLLWHRFSSGTRPMPFCLYPWRLPAACTVGTSASITTTCCCFWSERLGTVTSAQDNCFFASLTLLSEAMLAPGTFRRFTCCCCCRCRPLSLLVTRALSSSQFVAYS